MQAVADVVYITVFGCITIIQKLIGYNSLVDYKNLADYASFLIQKIAVKVMIVLVVGEDAVLDKGFGLIVPLVH